jgi:ribosomal protein L37AE/L43A
MVARTDKPEGPSASESFEAGKHFGVWPPEGCRHTLSGGAFTPDKKSMTKMSTLSAFDCGNSSFWDFRCIK